MSVIDTVKNWLGKSPGAPYFALPVVNVSMLQDFVHNGAITNRIKVKLGSFSDAGSVRAPANGLLRYVPSAALQVQQPFASRWPDLRLIDGSPFVRAEGQVLFETWPVAFRRLEGVFSTIEGPVPDLPKALPQTPLARWFVFGGISKPAMQSAATTLAKASFGDEVIDLQPFFDGKIPIYAPAHAPLLESIGGEIEVWAFDSAGLILDPLIYCAYVDELSSGSLFSSYREGTAPFDFGTPRQTFVFSDHTGAPYRQWVDPDPPQPPFPPIPPPPKVLMNPGMVVLNPNPIEKDLGATGVLTFAQGSADHTALKDKLVAVAVTPGANTRVGLHPHGVSGQELATWVGEWAFVRVRVTELAQWFPRNDNPHNQFDRYSEKNELVPLVDGKSAFREMYRVYRGTYRAEVYEREDSMPAGTAAPIAGSQILLSNFLVTPDSALLPKRALLTTTRTQNVDDFETNPLIGAQLFPLAAGGPDQRGWWISGTIPPGAAIELQPIGVSTSFFDNDPRIPGEDRGADLYGITVSAKPTVSAFANGAGRFFLPVCYLPDWNGKAELRVITWKPDEGDANADATDTSGKGRKQVHGLGIVDVPQPPSFNVPPAGAPWSADPQFTLSNNGVANGAKLTLQTGALIALATIVVVNQRSGDVVLHDVSLPASLTADIDIAVPNFSSKDVALVGALPLGGTDPVECGAFFAVTITTQQLASGFIPAHPKELLGVLREAIEGGVDVRLLVYRDQMKDAAQNLGEDPDAIPESPGGSVALVNALNASISGKHGQGISDPLLRETSSHHQKTSFVRGAGGVAALIGGVDHLPSRFGDPHDEIDPDRPTTVLWHDAHCLIRGKAAWDIYRNFRQRWNAARLSPTVIADGAPLTPMADVPMADYQDAAVTPVTGTHAVQISRTLPPGIDDYQQIVDKLKGEQSVLASYERAIATARRFLYIEDQYFWNVSIAQQINQRLHDGKLDFVIVVLPKQLAEFPLLDLALYAMRVRAVNMLLYGKAVISQLDDMPSLPKNVSKKVLVVHPVNEENRPIYVHCKMMVADDLWMTIGSSNINRRSMTYDSELNAASIDGRIRRGAHRTARAMRVQLMAHHLGLDDLERPLVEDPRRAFDLFRAAVTDPPPWLQERAESHQHLVPYDPAHTHYGIQPAEYDQLFLDAINIVLDPDGRTLSLAAHASQALGVLKALGDGDASQSATFGGLGMLRATFVFAPGVTPHHVLVDVTETASGIVVEAGPFDPAQPASLGVYKVGDAYTLAAAAFDAADTEIATASGNVTAAGFVTSLTLAFS